MAGSVPKSPPSLALNSLELYPAKASIPIKSERNEAESVNGHTAVSLFFETLAAIGMSDKEAAYTMAIDPAQLSRVKNGQARLPFDAIWRLPNRFWIAFRERIDIAKGLSEPYTRAIKAQRISELVKLLVEVA